MTEADMQNIVVATVQQPRDLAIVPNCGALGHEADLIRLTDRRMVHEVEVKTSRADLLADRKKSKWYTFGENVRDIYAVRGRVPHYLWYAVLGDIASVEDLPDYAGLMVVRGESSRKAKIVRQAKRLHREPAPDRLVEYVLRGQRIRYWLERDGLNPLREARDAARERLRAVREGRI